MGKNEIKIIKNPFSSISERLSLSELNDIRGGEQDGGICIGRSVVIIGDCFIVHCGIKIGCVSRQKEYLSSE
jgi:hypothetical protein